MKQLIPILLLLFAQFSTLSAQYSRVKIDLTTTSIYEIAKVGIEVDHGEYAEGRHLINDLSHQEIAILKANKFDYEILIEDVTAYYIAQNDATHIHDHNATERNSGSCAPNGSTYNYTTPSNYQFGSLGGYLTYKELLSTLDSMVALYPNLISAKTPVGEITTHEGRPIYWLRLSDNPTLDENEPAILYTALHHAREPNSLSQMIFYLWYLLENYETNEEVKYLVDNTEMYFMPCVNPDGYVYNETTDPNGGGLWRKNRWPNNGQVFGVDLNRNYDYKWGFNDIGSSTDYSSEIFRGTAAFSEPETQAVRDLCNAHEFQIALNYHTSGNLLIYPWGYNDQITEDHPTFKSMSEALTKENNFLYGTVSETVGYIVNGDSDDWMYGATESKPSIFSMTPEVGSHNFGFWPPQHAIDELNKSVLSLNLTAAHLLLNYGEAKEMNPTNFITSTTGFLELNVKKHGLQRGDLTLKVSVIGDNATIESNSTSWSLAHLEEVNKNYEYILADNIINGEEVLFLVEIDNGLFVKTDTIKKVFIDTPFTPILSDNGNSPNNWKTTGLWATTTASFFSSPSSYTDSPARNYASDTYSTISLVEPIDLENALYAFLNFSAKWDIEPDFDYAQITASVDGTNFSPLCGKYTKSGSMFQEEEAPLYDGLQSEWVVEEINLADYLGEKVWLRFRLVSDDVQERDGFYFDDLTVKTIAAVTTSSSNNKLISNFEVFPNPFNNAIKLHLEVPYAINQLELKLVNALGQIISVKKRHDLSAGTHQFILDGQQLTTGIYFLQLLINDSKVDTKRLIKLRK